MGDKKIKILIIAVLVLAIVSLGIAFAAFSTTLTINGSASVEATNWDIHFSETAKTSELTGLAPADPGVTISVYNSIGTAESTTSILSKNNFTWSGTFRTPGDTLEYRFYIVNAGDYNASLSAPTVYSPVCKINNVQQNTCPLIYTVTKDGTNAFTGSDSLEAGASQLVVVKAVLDPNYGGDGTSLSSADIDVTTTTVTFTYTQSSSAQTSSSGNSGNSGNSGQDPGAEPGTEPGESGGGETPSGNLFVNTDGAYYTYEGKRFIGTGVNNVIVSEYIISKAKYANANASQCSDSSTPVYNVCPSGTKPVFSSSPAADAASSYCTGCRLMTLSEAASWAGCTMGEAYDDECYNEKLNTTYNGVSTSWWFSDSYAERGDEAWHNNDGELYQLIVTIVDGVRPAVSISSSATMTGEGTSASPYVITVSQ